MKTVAVPLGLSPWGSRHPRRRRWCHAKKCGGIRCPEGSRFGSDHGRAFQCHVAARVQGHRAARLLKSTSASDRAGTFFSVGSKPTAATGLLCACNFSPITLAGAVATSAAPAPRRHHSLVGTLLLLSSTETDVPPPARKAPRRFRPRAYQKPSKRAQKGVQVRGCCSSSVRRWSSPVAPASGRGDCRRRRRQGGGQR